MNNHRIGSLVKYKARLPHSCYEFWFGIIVEIRSDHHFRILWCEPPHIIGVARLDDRNFEVIL